MQSLPEINGIAVDLCRLNAEVENRGGLKKVDATKEWLPILSALRIPITKPTLKSPPKQLAKATTTTPPPSTSQIQTRSKSKTPESSPETRRERAQTAASQGE